MKCVRRLAGLVLFLTLWGPIDSSLSRAAGTWSSALPAPPAGGVNNCILLSDGTVLGLNGNGGCARLTPDIHGSYLNGTWTALTPMNNSRLFYSSQLLTNGNLWVAGGEDGTGGSHSEIYDPLNNSWRMVPDPSPDPNFSDSISEILPNGNPFVPPVYTSTVCLIYNVGLDSWSMAASCRASQDEASWVKLPSDNIITIDAFSQNSEHYVPSLNQWVADGTLPVPLFDPTLSELGPGFLLPNGKAFYIGS
ncbi:MAG TPA: kelch repeat-containing protein, partial [Candidatus Acidoferrales bacterium]|nr:kelch repeat-containing protein [Candidatus Acidoferrales bacterium]